MKLLKRTVALLLTLTMLLTVSLNVNAATSATQGNCGENLTWRINSEGTLIIEGSGAMTDWTVQNSPWYQNSGITSVIIKSGVTSIGDHAFSQCKNITSVEIPGTVTRIGSNAFYGCSVLKISQLPNSVTSIGDYAFGYCKGITSFVIPESVTYIGNSAFVNCENMTSIQIPDGITKIDKYTFQSCKKLESIVIPHNVTTIGMGAFSSCLRLKTVFLPYGLNNDAGSAISSYAFDYCSELADVYFHGTEAQRSRLTIQSQNNRYLLNANWHYNYCCKNLIDNTHGFSGVCDEICDNCGYTRATVESHTYDNVCDAYCNECFSYRQIEGHKYDHACDQYCNKCNTYRATQHTYTNSCDNKCNVCGYTRTTQHTYSNVCDAVCNVCSYNRIAPHNYSNACDPSCNSCGVTRNASHTYTNACDSNCNVCGATRTAPHLYDNDCDNQCNLCRAYRAVAGHVYSNNCDTSCNICGYTRVTYHTYSDVCDATCNACGYTRMAPHRYDNDCDEQCNLCGAYRAVAGHAYSNSCDTSCNICGYTRTTYHSYSNVCDATCNVCGYTRTVHHNYDGDCDTQCNLCGVSRTVWTAHNYENATCTKPETCRVCKYTRGIALGHSFTNYVSDNNATYDADGTKTAKCDRCTETDTVVDLGTKLGTMVGIGIEALPNKLTYTEGEAFDPAGMVVKAYFNDDTSTEITGYTVTGYDAKPGTKTITVTYSGFTASFTVTVNEKTYYFPDVSQKDWFYSAVQYAVRKGYFSGHGNGTFGAHEGITREDFVVVLSRIEGVNLSQYSGETSFKDVSPNAYYAKAIHWASSNQVVMGYNDTEFGVKDTITREQLVTILYRYAMKKGYDISVNGSGEAMMNAFADKNKVSFFAKTACYWALEKGVLSGKNATTFDPGGEATRAQVAQILMNISTKKIMPF